MSEEVCPLTPALRRLLQVCVEERTDSTARLAVRLCVTESTVSTFFNRICGRLEVHTRAEAILKAMAHGWIKPPAP